MATSNTNPPSPTTTSPFTQQPTTAPTQTKRQHYSVQQLRAIASRLDLLKAGSLLLLPSVLPYLASALTALTAASSSSLTCLDNGNIGVFPSSGSEGLIELEGAEEGAYWWVAPLLPCVGLVLPMVLAKVLDATRSGNRRKNGSCCRTKRKLSAADATTTTCPYARVMSRLGFNASANEDAHLLPIEASLPNNNNISTPKQQKRGGLRRPRTLLLASLCLWSVLLASAPRLGLNKTVSFTVFSSMDGAFDDVMLTSSSCPTPSATSVTPPSMTTSSPVIVAEDTVSSSGSEGLTSTAWADVSDAVMDARVLSAEEDEVMDSEWRLTLPEETLDSMTAQQRQSLSALRDFWDAMEVVVGDSWEAEETREEFEEQLSEQLEQEHEEEKEEKEGVVTITQEELVEGMEEKMMDARDQITGDDDQEIREGKVFEYVPWWTEAMLFGISFAIGCVLVALAQARAHTLGLLQSASSRQKRFGDEDDDEVNELSDIDFDDIDSADSDSDSEDNASLSEKGKSSPSYKSLSPSSSTKNKARIIPRAVNRLLLLAALATNFWVVHSEYWDLPALVFVGLGSTAVLLAHTWVPRDL